MKNVTLTCINNDKISKTKMSNKNLGKGKIALTIDKILIGASAIFETIREMPGFEYLKTVSISNLTTKFNLWLAQMFPAPVPNLEGLKPEEIYALAQANQANQVNNFANTLGIIFSFTLEFIISHPTVVIVGLTSLTSLLIIPCKMLVKKPSRLHHQK